MYARGILVRAKNEKSRARGIVATMAMATMLVGGLSGLGASAAVAADDPSALPPLLQRTADVVTADPIPTVQIDNGYVWAQTTIGTTVYAVGKFDNAREPLAKPGTSLTQRSNVLAYDIQTGSLLPFAPKVNGVIKAVAASPDGSRIYIGGSFTSVNGKDRWNFAALDSTTGELVSGFAPSVGGSGVYAITADGSDIFLGGLFSQVNGVARKNLAALEQQNGTLENWAPTTDLQVDAMVMDPGGQKVVVGGRFSQVNGNTSMRGNAAIDRSTAALDTRWGASQSIRNGNTAGSAGVFALATDATGVYGSAWSYATGAGAKLEGAFAAEAGTGAVRWIADCLGDNYGIYSTGKVVYTTSHTHQCETMGVHPKTDPLTYQYAEAFTVDARGTLGTQTEAGYQNWAGTSAPATYAWTPDWAVGTTTGLGQAGLSITGAGDMISVGGEFRSVNNKQFEGLVRFSTTPPGGAKDGPRLSGATWTPKATSTAAGQVEVSIRQNWDRDDLALTYELRRSGAAEPVASVTTDSTWWGKTAVTLRDDSAPGGQAGYTVVAKDGDGNAVTSGEVTVTVAGGDAAGGDAAGDVGTTDYRAAVLADRAQLYYPLGSSSRDLAGFNPPVIGRGVAVAKAGVRTTDGGSSSFDGTSAGRVSSSRAVSAPREFSTETWFRTDTRAGGKLIGFGSQPSGTSASFDRQLYMTNDGRIVFGTYYNGVRATIQSAAGLNDGTWHHVVGTQSAAGMTLFVDGRAVATNATARAKSYVGYWRIGGDNLSGWPSAPSSAYFRGQLDEVAVYPVTLSAAQVQRHFAIGDGL